MSIGSSGKAGAASGSGHRRHDTALMPDAAAAGSSRGVLGGRAETTADALTALRALDAIAKEATARVNRGESVDDTARKVEEAKLVARQVQAERQHVALQRQLAAARRKQLAARGGAFGASLRDAGHTTSTRVAVVAGKGGAGMGSTLLGVEPEAAAKIEWARTQLGNAVSEVAKAHRDYVKSLDSLRRKHRAVVDTRAGRTSSKTAVLRAAVIREEARLAAKRRPDGAGGGLGCSTGRDGAPPQGGRRGGGRGRVDAGDGTARVCDGS